LCRIGSSLARQQHVAAGHSHVADVAAAAAAAAANDSLLSLFVG